MFEKINFRNLTNTETYTLVGAIIAILSGVDVELLKLKVWLDKLLEPFKKLETSIGLDRGSDKTELIRKADDLRDSCFKAFKAYVEACRMRNKQEWQEAADLLWRIISNHGLLLYKESYAKESSLLDNLIIELNENTEAKAAMTTIQILDWFNEMKDAQTAFKGIWGERREEKISKPSSESVQARKNIKETSEYLFQSIELNYLSSGDENYLHLINEINEEVKKANTIAKARLTRRKNHEEEESEEQA